MAQEAHKIFKRQDARRVLKNKFIVILGDSIQRGVYKDLVLLLQDDRCLEQYELKNKGEMVFHNDELIEGGRKGAMSNGIAYKEVRQYQQDEYLIRFYFVTRCYNNYVESVLNDLKEGPAPDLVIMNSCLWDISRYGKESIVAYKENLCKLFSRFQESLPNECLVIWTTTLPISRTAIGGFIIPEVAFLSSTLRLDILEANYYATQVASKYKFDILDLHFYLRHYLRCRVKDGVHWDMMAHRYITNLILSHVCDAWNLKMPATRPVTFASYGSIAGTMKRYTYDGPQFSGFGVLPQGAQDWDSHFRFGSGARRMEDRNQILSVRSGNGTGRWEHDRFESQNYHTRENRSWAHDGYGCSIPSEKYYARDIAWWENDRSGSQNCPPRNGPKKDEFRIFQQDFKFGSSGTDILSKVTGYSQLGGRGTSLDWQFYREDSYRGAVSSRRHLRESNYPYSQRHRNGRF